MKKCIWCLKSSEVTFNKIAHTIPKSLGGIDINDNVCDQCNKFFGDKLNGNFSIEEVFKETFIISKYRLLEADNFNTSIRSKNRYKSRFFNLKLRENKPRLVIKPSYKQVPSFQAKLCDYFKRGLYKVFLEEYDRQFGKGHDHKFDSIRHYARYGLGNLPVFYFNRSVGMIHVLRGEIKNPKFRFDAMNYLFRDENFIEVEFIGHVFGIPISNNFDPYIKYYIKNSMSKKRQFFSGVNKVKYLYNIDLTLKILDK